METMMNHRFVQRGPLFLILLGLVVGTIGPFGQTQRFELFERIGLWTVYGLVGVPMLWATYATLHRRWDGYRRWGFLSRTSFAALTASVPLLLMVELIGLSQGRPFPSTLLDWIVSLVEVLILGGGVLAAWLAWSPIEEKEDREILDLVSNELAEPMSGSTKSQQIRREVQAASNGQLYAIQAEEHYSRIFRRESDEQISFSLSEVMAHGCLEEGAQVHRSWWVSRNSVIDARKKGSAAELILANGLVVPVARRRLSDLRKTGWPV